MFHVNQGSNGIVAGMGFWANNTKAYHILNYTLPVIASVMADTPGGYSIYPRVGRCGPAPQTLTLFKVGVNMKLNEILRGLKRE